ncbi:putative basic proline-rich protein-like [Iris pallida]|uniref:Basic proline-rich protein-like n=1 Tax=Iris pallida TaxID=29817 RepID=A0AAX6GL69_IRIPA|nr:putative basic proline-rich protein-like [Iris pallida]
MIPYSKPSPILPPELLQMIAARLTDIVDYVSFRGVCSSWRSAARPADAPKQLPWLLLPYNPAAPARSFYGLSTARTYSFDCGAAVVGRVVCGSSFGWLALIAPDSALSLWNPVTRAVLPLPPPTGLPSYLGPAAPRCEFGSRGLDEHCCPTASGCVRPGYPCRVSLSSGPAAPGCVALVVLALSSAFAYCRIGDTAWTVRETGLEEDVNSVAFRDGRFYALDSYGGGVVLDVDDPSRRSDIRNYYGSCLPLFGSYVTQADDGNLYMLQNYVWFDEEEEEEQCLDVLRLVRKKGRYWWKKVRRVGDLAFFLSGNHASAVRPTGPPRGGGERVYFSEENCGALEDLRTDGHGIRVFDLEEEEFKPCLRQWSVVPDASRSPTWVMPTLL